MERGDTHYIVFTNDSSIIKIDSLEELFRKDIKLILRRTFLKKSRGQGLYNYFKTDVIDNEFNIVKNNEFTWNSLKCKILEDEYWGYPIKNSANASVVLDIEIEDHLKLKKVCKFDMYKYKPFEKIQHDLFILDRVGTHEALIEINKLIDALKTSSSKIIALEKKIAKLNK